MNKMIDICLCILAIPVWVIADILELLSNMLHASSCFLEHFIAFLINKQRK